MSCLADVWPRPSDSTEERAFLALGIVLAIGLLGGASGLLAQILQPPAWVAGMQETEVHATLELRLLSVVMLPILPDRGYRVDERASGPMARTAAMVTTYWQQYCVKRIGYQTPESGSIPGKGIPLWHIDLSEKNPSPRASAVSP